jgi:FAD:protein FMN transferase
MRRKQTLLVLSALIAAVGACDRGPAEPTRSRPADAKPSFSPVKVDYRNRAMGTEIHIIAHTSERSDEPATRAAIERAQAEIVRLERLMSTWRDDSELSEVNRRAGARVKVSFDTFAVLEKSKWAAEISDGTFDITYASMGPLWKFGDAAEEDPKPPSAAEIRRGISRIDWKQLELDRASGTVGIGKHQKVDVGGIAKGYAVDRAAAVLRAAGLDSFLVQAGGDLYGAGKKPDGSRWVAGIRDPRGPADRFFATIELEDHAFSTAGDYARSYFHGGKRYHHIIDPRTGYPATASRSVTIWAPDALTADVVDDAVFILGKQRGLEIVESLEGVGAVIVDAQNQVTISRRLQGKVKLLAPPSDGL